MERQLTKADLLMRDINARAQPPDSKAHLISQVVEHYLGRPAPEVDALTAQTLAIISAHQVANMAEASFNRPVNRLVRHAPVAAGVGLAGAVLLGSMALGKGKASSSQATKLLTPEKALESTQDTAKKFKSIETKPVQQEGLFAKINSFISSLSSSKTATAEPSKSTAAMSAPLNQGTPALKSPTAGLIMTNPQVPQSKSAQVALARVKNLDPTIADALDYAAKETKVPKYALYAFANKESHFGAFMNNTTASAQGVMQVMPNTFSDMLKAHGAPYGLTSKDITDPKANALMGAFYFRDLAEAFKRHQGKDPSVTDVYTYYLLGPTGGNRFHQNLKANPEALAPDDFGKAAKANPSVFFDKVHGKYVPRSYAAVYNYLATEVGAPATAMQAALPKATDPGPQMAMMPEPTVAPPVPMNSTALPGVPNTKTADATPPAPVKSVAVPKDSSNTEAPKAVQESKPNSSPRASPIQTTPQAMTKDRNGRIFIQ